MEDRVNSQSMRDFEDESGETNSEREASYRRFEILVLRILARKCQLENRSFITEPGPKWGYFDAVAPEGIDDMRGPTVIEIKQILPISKTDLIDSIVSKATVLRAKSILLIISQNVPVESEELLSRRLTDTPQVKIWGINKVMALSSRFAEYVSDLVPSVSKVGFQAFERTEPQQYLKEAVKAQGSHIKSLKRAFSEKHISLFLGAGISHDPGIPTWDALLTELMCKVVDKKASALTMLNQFQKHQLAERLRYHMDGSLLTQARYAKATLGDTYGPSVVQLLWSNLSSNKACYRLVNEVCNLCRPIRTGVRSVVTYNWDDLVETQLTKIHRRHRTISGIKSLYSGRELPLYHVHGFIPKSANSLSPVALGEEPVFSEDTYHSLINDPTHWANVIQLNTLRESICLMIGLSMSDPNLRRLLELMSRQPEAPRHFAILKLVSDTDFMCKPNELSLPNDIAIKTLVAKHNKAIEIILNQLGINVIWVQKYDEIPKILAQIRK